MKTVIGRSRITVTLMLVLCIISVLSINISSSAQAEDDEPPFLTPPTLPDLSAFLPAPAVIAPNQVTAPATFIVNTTVDMPDNDLTDMVCETETSNRACTLRAAIEQANATPDQDTIEFDLDLADDDPFLFTPMTPLPVIVRPVVIDGTTQPGYVDEPLITLDAAGLTYGLAVMTNNSIITGLHIANAVQVNVLLAGSNNTVRACHINGVNLDDNGFRVGNVGIGILGAANIIGGTGIGDENVMTSLTTGILVEGAVASGNVIQDNVIRLEMPGSTAGIYITQATKTVIGGASPGKGNVISAISLEYGSFGIYLDRARSTKIMGNILRPENSQSYMYGIAAFYSAKTTIGGSAVGAGNVISGNHMGIMLFEGTESKVFGNLIGSNSPGKPELSNEIALSVDGGESTQIGGVKPGQGNVISGNKDGIYSDGGTGLTIRGNKIGTDDTGTLAVGNERAIYLSYYCSDYTIGGTTPSARNLISGNDAGIQAFSIGRVVIQGNYIGTDVTGTTAIPKAAAVHIAGENALIGGSVPGAGNLISGNTVGMMITRFIDDNFQPNLISGSTVGLVMPRSNILIQQNLIGTDASGLVPLGNASSGIYLHLVDGVTIGGSTALTRNVISGNGEGGITIWDSRNITIQGNYIGANSKGKSAPGMGNTGDGISILRFANSFGNTIGGAGKQANRIMDNSLAGVRFLNDDVYVHGFAMQGNHMSGNGGLGIDIATEGVTVNGPIENDFVQNFPVINFLKRKGGAAHPKTQIKGSLNSTPFGDYTLYFYSVKTCDPSGYGEADKYLGQKVVQADEIGEATFNVKFPVKLAEGDSVVATASDYQDSTSEFSACFDGITPAPVLEIPTGFRD